MIAGGAECLKKSSVLTQLTSLERSLTTLREQGIASLFYKRTSFCSAFLYISYNFNLFFSIVKKNLTESPTSPLINSTCVIGSNTRETRQRYRMLCRSEPLPVDSINPSLVLGKFCLSIQPFLSLNTVKILTRLP